jgi:hypothetical protein
MKLEPERGNEVDFSKTRPGSPAGSVLGGMGAPDPDFTPQPLNAEPVDVPYAEEPSLTEEKGTILDAEESLPTSTSIQRTSDVDSPLFDQNEAQDLQSRWNDIQVAFVDEPRAAVERANGLVMEVTRRLTDSFGSGRQKLENEWNRGGEVSTETLRVTLQHYRSFFNRLLAI